MKHVSLPAAFSVFALLFAVTSWAEAGQTFLENGEFLIAIDNVNGAVTSLRVKRLDCELIGEPRLATSFRLLLPLPEYHCRAHEREVRITLTVPAGVSGTLRLYVIDPDEFYGGRKQEIRIDGKFVGVIEDFVAGQWIEYPVPGEATQDGAVGLQVMNLKETGNCVVSMIEFLENQ